MPQASARTPDTGPTSTKGRASTALVVEGPVEEGWGHILSEPALAFVEELVRRFGPRIQQLLAARKQRQAGWDAGELPGFLPETASIRESDWTIATLPSHLLDRRVEITGPVDRKMIINALNSGAKVFMADFEDSNAPTWSNNIEGQLNLFDAVRGTISFVDQRRGKQYRLRDETAVLMVRPRGLHLPERGIRFGGEPVPGCLVDFGLFFFHNAAEQLRRGVGPAFYLPKLEHWEEARLWDEILSLSEDLCRLPRGTAKVTVLIETLPAAFQMNEILYALRAHMAGLNCGRWDYIFSCIKVSRAWPDRVFPDRSEIGMTQPFMRAYTQLLVQTCHRRGALAMGGMAAQIPIKTDEEANRIAIEKVRQDKLREVNDGHDGTWVAHPGLVPLAMEIFDAQMRGPNQLDSLREDVSVSADDLLAVPQGSRTLAGLRHNIRVGVQYLEAWLGGNGCVPLNNLMEDAATAEISRAQVWQWLHHGVSLQPEDGGSAVRLDTPLFTRTLDEELRKIREEVGDSRFLAGRYQDASGLFARLCTAPELADFLTLPAYTLLQEAP